MEITVQIVAFVFASAILALPFILTFKCIRFVQARLGIHRTPATSRAKGGLWSFHSKTLCFSCREYGAVVGKPSLGGTVNNSGFANWRVPLDLHLPKALAEFLEERREWIDGLEEKHLSLLGPEGPDWQEFSDFLNRELERAGIRKGVLLLKRPHRISPDLAHMLALSHHLQRQWDTHQGWLEDWSRTAGPQWSEAIPGELVRVFGDRYESLLAYVEWFGITRGVHLSMKRIRKQAQAIFLEQQDALRASSLSSHSQGIGVTIQDVDAMDPFDFEVFLGKLFTNLGYTITETPKTGDQGADVLLEKNGSSTVIQAKLYTSPVGNKAVQEAHAAKAHFHCDSAQVITNNTFTRSAQELAGTTGVQLVSREGLTALLEGYNAALQYRQDPVPAA